MILCFLYIIVSFLVFSRLAEVEILQDQLPCQIGFFKNGQGNCQTVLSCDEIKTELTFIEEMPGGYVKKMFLVKWKNMSYVYSVPRDEMMNEDFEHGMKMMERFQGTKYVVQLVGYCYRPLQILVKYYKYGSADNLDELFHMINLTDFEEAKIRLQLAQDYLVIINFLHNSPAGCRVMCDSNSLKKTMSQFLVSDNFHLLVSDLDALPKVENNSKIKCGHKQLYGSFVAPEQLWHHKDRQFVDSEMPGYDEKTDIWKIPDVVFYLLGNTSFGDRIKFMLFDLFKKCKNIKPSQRPDAKEILSQFLLYKKQILKELNNFHIDDEL